MLTDAIQGMPSRKRQTKVAKLGKMDKSYRDETDRRCQSRETKTKNKKDKNKIEDKYREALHSYFTFVIAIAFLTLPLLILLFCIMPLVFSFSHPPTLCNNYAD